MLESKMEEAIATCSELFIESGLILVRETGCNQWEAFRSALQ